jgi:hypothetical protein
VAWVDSRKFLRCTNFRALKFPEDCLRNPEKAHFVPGLTTEMPKTSETDPADRVRLVRFEFFSGQKFLVRKLERPDLFCREIFLAGFFSARNLENQKKFRLKVENSKKIRRESWKKWCKFNN